LTRTAGVLITTVTLLSLATVSLAAGQEPAKAPAPAKSLTVEAIYGRGPMIGNPPGELNWSPDGQHLSYMDGGELVDLDPATGKEVEWSIEGGSPNGLSRSGWKRTSLKPGDKATVVIHPLKDGTNGGSLATVTVNGVQIGGARS